MKKFRTFPLGKQLALLMAMIMVVALVPAYRFGWGRGAYGVSEHGDTTSPGAIVVTTPPAVEVVPELPNVPPVQTPPDTDIPQGATSPAAVAVQANARSGFTTTPMIAAGGDHTVGLRYDGTVWKWGVNYGIQLGQGSSPSNNLTPVQVQGLSNIVYISAGSSHTAALRNDGTVWTWGWNFHGQLGDGTVAGRYTPMQVQGLTNITRIAAGNASTFAVRSDGTVWAWGFNGSGQLGDGTTIHRITPVQVQGITGVTHIAAGNSHTVALRSDSTVWAWGFNGSGQLGDGTTIHRITPVQVQGLTGVTQVSAGHDHTAALRNDGTVWTWGWNFHGQLGYGTFTRRYTPVQVQGLTNITHIAAGHVNTFAVRNDGTVWGWGGRWHGQIGCGTMSDTARFTPVQVQGLSHISRIATGYRHTVALRSDGIVWAWGNNLHGQLGTTVSSTTPVQVVGTGGVGHLNLGGGTPQPPPTGTAFITLRNSTSDRGRGTVGQTMTVYGVFRSHTLSPNAATITWQSTPSGLVEFRQMHVTYVETNLLGRQYEIVKEIYVRQFSRDRVRIWATATGGDQAVVEIAIDGTDPAAAAIVRYGRQLYRPRLNAQTYYVYMVYGGVIVQAVQGFEFVPNSYGDITYYLISRAGRDRIPRVVTDGETLQQIGFLHFHTNGFRVGNPYAPDRNYFLSNLTSQRIRANHLDAEFHSMLRRYDADDMVSSITNYTFLFAGLAAGTVGVVASGGALAKPFAKFVGYIKINQAMDHFVPIVSTRELLQAQMIQSWRVFDSQYHSLQSMHRFGNPATFDPNGILLVPSTAVGIESAASLYQSYRYFWEIAVKYTALELERRGQSRNANTIMGAAGLSGSELLSPLSELRSTRVTVLGWVHGAGQRLLLQKDMSSLVGGAEQDLIRLKDRLTENRVAFQTMVRDGHFIDQWGNRQLTAPSVQRVAFSTTSTYFDQTIVINETVDVRVYCVNNQLIGLIEAGYVIYYSGIHSITPLVAMVDEGAKVLFFPHYMNYRIEINVTGNGIMTYYQFRMDDNRNVISSTVMPGIFVNDGDTLTVNADAGTVDYGILFASGAPQNVTFVTTTSGNGRVYSNGSIFVIGGTVIATAVADEGNAFIGWYENGLRVSTVETFAFTATTSRTLEARFVAGNVTRPPSTPGTGGGTPSAPPPGSGNWGIYTPSHYTPSASHAPSTTTPRPPRPFVTATGNVRINVADTNNTIALSPSSANVTAILRAATDTAYFNLANTPSATAVTLTRNVLRQFANAGLDVQFILPSETITICNATTLRLLQETTGNRIEICLVYPPTSEAYRPVNQLPPIGAPLLLPPAPVSVLRLTIGSTAFIRHGISQVNDVAPFLDLAYGRTMVPVRIVAEALGADVGFCGDTQTVLITIDGQELSLSVGVPLPGDMGVPVIVNSRTFVPVRYVSEMLGATVRWCEENQAVHIYN